MAIIKIRDANRVNDEQIKEWDLNETIVLLLVYRPDDGIHRIYKLHDLPDNPKSFESAGDNFRWIPLFKTNNSFVSSRTNVIDSIKDVINRLYVKEVVAITGGVKEMCEYILTRVCEEGKNNGHGHLIFGGDPL